MRHELKDWRLSQLLRSWAIGDVDIAWMFFCLEKIWHKIQFRHALIKATEWENVMRAFTAFGLLQDFETL